MAFFARPNLDNVQFKQLDGSVLTLSGQTQIATTSGLTLIGDGGMYIPIIATGATNDFVLTYDDSVQAIVLRQSTSSGATTTYPYTGLTTCGVGGLSASTDIYNCQLSCIIQCMVSPTLSPTLSNPSISSLYLIPASPTVREVGSTVALCACTDFDPGSISPQYSSACSCRSNGTYCYSYDVFGTPCACQTAINSPSNLSNFGTLSIALNTNSVAATVYYCCGTQPKDSSGANYCSPLPSGTTNLCTTGSVAAKTLTGVYPWFWGTSTTAPNVSTSGCSQCLINSYTCKCVASSTGNITVTNFNVTGKYIWFATPYASCSKSCWQGANNVSNNGIIPGGLFPAPTSWNIVSPESCWGSTCCYKIYVSNYATDINYGMTFCN